jgi:hypothetical protein
MGEEFPFYAQQTAVSDAEVVNSAFVEEGDDTDASYLLTIVQTFKQVCVCVCCKLSQLH